jgi:hypothetical protein
MLTILILNTSCFPNNQSSRDLCKEGTQNKIGKKENRDSICFSSAISYKRAEENDNSQQKSNALLSYLVSLEELRKCDERDNNKFGFND